jgi:hypothetical protein
MMMNGFIVLVTVLSATQTGAFSPSSFSSQAKSNLKTSFGSLSLNAHDRKQNTSTSNKNNTAKQQPNLAAASLALTIAIASASPLVVNPAISNAYEQTDYASETVTASVQSLKDAKGDTKATMSTFESIAEIITEGKGVGGNINYST